MVSSPWVGHHETQRKADEYLAEYYPPKDPLFEKWDIFHKSMIFHQAHSKSNFENAKSLSLFTAGLDEAIERFTYPGDCTNEFIITTLKEIKERLGK